MIVIDSRPARDPRCVPVEDRSVGFSGRIGFLRTVFLEFWVDAVIDHWSSGFTLFLWDAVNYAVNITINRFNASMPMPTDQQRFKSKRGSRLTQPTFASISSNPPIRFLDVMMINGPMRSKTAKTMVGNRSDKRQTALLRPDVSVDAQDRQVHWWCEGAEDFCDHLPSNLERIPSKEKIVSIKCYLFYADSLPNCPNDIIQLSQPHRKFLNVALADPLGVSLRPRDLSVANEVTLELSFVTQKQATKVTLDADALRTTWSIRQQEVLRTISHILHSGMTLVLFLIGRVEQSVGELLNVPELVAWRRIREFQVRFDLWLHQKFGKWKKNKNGCFYLSYISLRRDIEI
jgi:hypothetical protein